MVIRAPPDGYTYFSAGPASAINATLYDKLSFNFLRDTAPPAARHLIDSEFCGTYPACGPIAGEVRVVDATSEIEKSEPALARQEMSLGALGVALHAELARWQSERRVARLWSRDAALWTDGDEGRWLGWLSALDAWREQRAPLRLAERSEVAQPIPDRIVADGQAVDLRREHPQKDPPRKRDHQHRRGDSQNHPSPERHVHAGELLQLRNRHEVRRSPRWRRDTANQGAERSGDHQCAAEVTVRRPQPGIAQETDAKR